MNDKLREEQINLFLHEVFLYANENRLTNDDIHSLQVEIYRRLMNYEISFNNKNVDVREHFQTWLNYFPKYAGNTSAFLLPEKKEFCYFSSEKEIGDIMSVSDPVKIYISLDKEHIKNGGIKIIKFLNDNNIFHQSKIASQIRSDGIVLRIAKMDDAIKVLNFINSDQYLIEGHQQVNPFVFPNGICGLAIDNYHSYNKQVSQLMASYILDNILCDKKDINCNNFNRYILSVEESDISLNEIKSLISKSLSTSNFNTFRDHFYSVRGNAPKKRIDFNYEMEVLNEAIKNSLIKHGSRQAIGAVMMYLNYGEVNSFSRGNIVGTNKSFREFLNKIDHFELREKIKEISGCFDLRKAVLMSFFNYYGDSLNR